MAEGGGVGFGDRWGVLGWAEMRKDDEGKKREEDRGTQVYLCVEKVNSNGTKCPSWCESSVIGGQRVDDVTIAPTNLVLYIIILPFLSHVDPFPATTSPLSDFVL